MIWTGRPKGGILFTGRDIFLIPFSILWGSLAIFWEYGILTTTHSRHAVQPAGFNVISPLFGVPFVLVGLFMIFGRFIVDAYLRNQTDYAVTNQRILIQRTGQWNRFVSLSLDRLPSLNLTEGRNGYGTITFGEVAQGYSGRNGFQGWIASLDPTPKFVNIENVRSVFDQIQRLAQPAAKKDFGF